MLVFHIGNRDSRLMLITVAGMALLMVFALAQTGCVAGGGSSRGGRSMETHNILNKQEIFVFNALPKSVGELQAMPEAAMTTPFMTAALTVAALSAYGDNPSASIAMLNVLRGPQPLSNRETQFLRERLSGKKYKPFSYFEGATPQNGYTPHKPYRITVSEQAHSYPDQAQAKLFIYSAGADSARPVTMRLKPSTGQWFVIEYSSLLLDMRVPDSQNRWR